MLRLPLVCLLLFSVSVGDAFGQDKTRPGIQLQAFSNAQIKTFNDSVAFQAGPSSRDSIRNGTLVGAIVGGVGGFALGLWYCHVVREEGDPGCFPGSLAFAGIGAGAGAAAGAGIDAALMRRQLMKVTMRF